MAIAVGELFRACIGDLEPAAPVSVDAGTPVRTALGLMRDRHIGCVLVTKDRALQGILTERDLVIEVLGEGRLDEPVDGIMTRDPETLSLDHAIAYALNRMSLGGYRHIPLVDDEGVPQGIISVKDIISYVVEHFPEEIYNLPPEPDTIGNAREGA